MHILKTSLLFTVIMFTGFCCGLQCYGCRDSEEEMLCTNMDKFEHLNCSSDYTCYKRVVHRVAEDRIINLVTRDCRHRNLDLAGENNGCEYDQSMSIPHSGITCLCYDQDYCNHAEPLIKHGSLQIHFIWTTFCLALYILV